MHDLSYTVRELALDTLEPSPENVRKAPPDAAALAALKASIAAHGLIASLVVRPVEGVRPRYAVVAGGRRLAALKALAAEGAIPVNHPVPCRVDAGATPAGELSLAENVVRVAMHPADQAEAFGRLAAGGASVAAIAVRFGASERVVEQRLRLGNAAPALLDAYRAGDLDLDTLQAFAVTADTARQLAVYEELRAGHVRPWQVRRRLTEGRAPGASALARFVGAEAYEAAGGALERDLFADDAEGEGLWFEDPTLLGDLAMQRLQVAADELEGHWKWAEAMLDADWSATARFGRVHPAPALPTEAERGELDRLEARLDELGQQDAHGAGEAQEERRLAERIEAIEAAVEARALYSPDDRAMAGCIVTLGDEGTMAVIRGLVRPEDVPAQPSAQAGGAGDAPAGECGTNAGRPDPRISAPARTPPPADPGAEARKAAGVGIGLADDLRAIRTAHVKAQLSCRFEAAFDLLLFHLARSVFGKGDYDGALDIAARETPDAPAARANDPAFAKVNAGAMHLEVDRIGQPLEWMDKPAGEAFAELRAMSAIGKEYLFASCVARTLKGQLAFEAGARPEVEATVARLDVDFARCYRPDAAFLFGRLRKDRLLAIARDTLGEAWAAAHRNERKAALAEAMEAAFAAGDAVPAGVGPSARAAALAWVPPGFGAFDTGRAEAAEADAEPAPAHGSGETGTSPEGVGEAPPASGGDAPEPAPAESPAAPGNGETAPEVPPANGGSAPGPHAGPEVPEGAPEGEADARETVHEAGAASQTAPVPGNGHDPEALPAFLHRTA